jgi:phosphatidylglycerol---prolipoprotein diacylglyceryl transferase
MHSILFRIGPIPIYAYGFMLMLAFLAGTAVAVRLGRRRGISSEHVLDLTAIILVAGIVGARLLYLALEWSYFREHPAHIWRLWEGGLSFQGGLLAALLAGALYCRRQGLSFLAMGDVIAPGTALGYAIGRVGCFLNGCCYGAPTSLPWACQFHDPPVTGPLTPPSHPTQIYASLASLVIFGLLMGVFRRQRVTGQVLWSYLLLYAVYRFAIEFLRKGATAEVMGALLTGAQWASVTTALVAGAALIRLSRRPKETSAEPGSGTAKNTPGQASPRTPVGASKK